MKKRIEIEIEVPEGREFVELRPSGNGEFFNSPMGSSDHFQSWILTTKNVKPAKKVIDLSCIVGSGIDCEFSQDDNNWNVIGGLREIRPDPYNQKGATLYDSAHKRSRLACRVRQSPHVHFWGGDDKCPLPEGLMVRLHFRDGGISEYSGQNDYFAEVWRWGDGDIRGEIIAFKVLGVAEGWRYEWEEECKE